MISDDKVKLEAYVARPPTSKCREVIAVLEETVHRYPDQVQLVVFERGVPWLEEPSRNLQYAIHKANTVPMCFVAGKLVAGGRIPSADEVEHAVENALRSGSTVETSGQTSVAEDAGGRPRDGG